ncbi:hypothetical protein ALQ17_02215 [Pseudomonas fluorescens]|nr:hypothetical protein ALQ17_02215 [Pseudomonas fluorescens]
MSLAVRGIGGFFFLPRTVIIALPQALGTKTMELTLEAVALFALKLVHETDGGSPVLRDDPVMDGYEREVFGLLVRQGDLAAIQSKVAECVDQALEALGGADTVMGRELQRLALGVRQASTLDELNAPLNALKDYLKAIL